MQEPLDTDRKQTKCDSDPLAISRTLEVYHYFPIWLCRVRNFVEHTMVSIFYCEILSDVRAKKMIG